MFVPPRVGKKVLPLNIQANYFRQWLHPDEINPMFLLFRDKSWEGPYVREHDPLFKFYVLASFGILVSMGSILLLTEKQ